MTLDDLELLECIKSRFNRRMVKQRINMEAGLIKETPSNDAINLLDDLKMLLDLLDKYHDGSKS